MMRVGFYLHNMHLQIEKSCEFPHQEATGKKIVEKCRGLPLVAKTIGGSLHLNQNPTHWNKILKSHI